MLRRPTLVIILALALAAPLAPAAPSAAGPCATVMPGVGPVCPHGPGLYEVFAADGSSLGFVHGTDPVLADLFPATPSFGTSPACVGASATDYYVQVIYARAVDDADQYASLVPTIRALVGNANALVDNAAIANGQRADLKVLCASGLVTVANETLPTAKASASFSTIVSDLRAKGYTNGHLKYWVYYDDTSACTCGGTGHVYGDDSLALTNANNGNQAAMFAVDFGYNDVRVWTHELGHNLGAVQLSAPHTTGAYHCVDGRDTMCYDDGGPNGANYSTTACSVEVFDCGKDDYFNAAPANGSYLATHWNVGSRLDRFLDFGTPVMDYVSCPAVERGSATTCTFRASDDSSGVQYAITWGDGASTTTPFVAPGVDQIATHTYADLGNFTVTINATDNATAPSTSAPRSTIASVVADPPPVLVSLSCATVEVGTPSSCAFRADDDASLVNYTITWGDGVLASTGFVAPNATRTLSHSYAAAGNYTVGVNATTDGPFPVTSATRNGTAIVAFDLTPPTLTVLDPRAGFVYDGCAITQAVQDAPPTFVQKGCVRVSATDARSGVAFVRIVYEGRLVANLTAPPYVAEFPVTPSLASRVDVIAVDAAGNSASTNLLVVAI